jgi:CheY-like chemotaxis protein
MPKTLLLADDSVTIQKVVGLSFASEDVVLVTVSNGDDALVRVRELKPDLVLADVVMPGKNGYEVCESIKTDPALRHIPVLLLTGTFEAFDQERARRAGADGHVTKPFEAQALVQQVKDLMARVAAPVEAPKAAGSVGFDVPTLPPLEAAPVLREAAAPAASAPPEDPFFADDLEEATRFDDDALDIDADAAAGELELATVAEDEDEADDLLAPSDFAPVDEPMPARAPGGGEAFDIGQESFRGSPLFAPEQTDSDLHSPRAVAPAPANVLPEDDFDLGLEDAPFPVLPMGDTSTRVVTPAPANLFGDDDPSGDAMLDPGRAEGFDLSFADLDEPLAAAGVAQEPALEPTFEPIFEPAPERAEPSTPAASASRAERVAAADATGSPAGLSVDLSPVLRQRLHDTLEKVAWEAFADLSDTIVRQALERIETIAWEVIPQMAEQLIREEIRRMKGENEES